MPFSAALADQAIRLFNHRWRLRPIPDRLRGGEIDCRLSWLMPDLIRLAQEFPDDEPLDAMRPLVRRMVQDRATCTRTAAPEDLLLDDLLLDEYTAALVAAVERVRAEARAAGHWVPRTDTAAPIMCG